MAIAWQLTANQQHAALHALLNKAVADRDRPSAVNGQLVPQLPLQTAVDRAVRATATGHLRRLGKLPTAIFGNSVAQPVGAGLALWLPNHALSVRARLCLLRVYRKEFLE